MKTLFLMISFLTRIPVPQVEYSDERYRRGLKLMPLVGLLLGGLLYGLSFLHLLLGRSVTALLLTLCYIALTGGLHLDGLADTCDGVFSGRDRERKLLIMRDSHNGTFGVIALVMACLSYYVLFSEVPFQALVLFPVVGKTAAILSCVLADYVRPAGLGKVVAENCGAVEVSVSLLVTAVAAVLMGPVLCIPAAVLALLSVAAFTKGLKKSIGGITGDTMGMVCEVSQLLFLVCVVAAGRILTS